MWAFGLVLTALVVSLIFFAPAAIVLVPVTLAFAAVVGALVVQRRRMQRRRYESDREQVRAQDTERADPADEAPLST